MARDGRRERDARDRAARERGFASYAAQRRAPRRITAPSDLGQLPEAARQSRNDAAFVISRARREKVPVEVVARAEGVPMASVRWWFPNALKPTRHGRTRPKRADRSLRLRPLAVDGTLTFVATRGSRAAVLAERAFSTQWAFVHGRATEGDLTRFTGVRIAGHEVETDPDVLERLGYQGFFAELDEIYRDVLG
jgi:hypothetical protein